MTRSTSSRVASASSASAPPTSSVPPAGPGRPRRTRRPARRRRVGVARPGRPAAPAFEPVARATTWNASGWRGQHVDRLAPDRAGRAEQGDPARPSLPCPAASAEEGKDIQRDDRRREHERIDPVEHPAVARDERPRILGPGRPLDDRFGEVAGLGRQARSAARGPAHGAGSGRDPRAGARPRPSSAITPPTRPSIVFDGEMWVRNLRPADVLADEIGARVVGPDREHQQQDPAALAAERVRAARRAARPAPTGRAG